MIAHPSPQGFKISAKAPLEIASASGTTIPSADVIALFPPESSVFCARLVAAFLS
jgi:hypothetical protein